MREKPSERRKNGQWQEGVTRRFGSKLQARNITFYITNFPKHTFYNITLLEN